MRAFALLIGLVLALVWPAVSPAESATLPGPPSAKPDAVSTRRVQAALGKLPLYFIENRGQLDSRVAYVLQGRDTAVYFTAEGITFALTGRAQEHEAEPRQTRPALRTAAFHPDSAAVPERQRWAITLEFLGANPGVKPVGHEPTPAVVSYFKGPQEQWKTALPTYASVVYADLWPGIDLVYSGKAGRLKYTFLVKPGADPGQIRLAYRGVTGVRLTEAGQMEIATPVGGFTEDTPYVYQEVDGQQVQVAAAYVLEPASASDSHSYSFRVGAYDTSLPLVLDPVVLLYAGYIGGTGTDEGNGIAVDGAGNAYVIGTTFVTDGSFPVTVGPDLTWNGGNDAFVAKVNTAGTALVYAGYIGGSDHEQGHAIAVDSAGNAYVTGLTYSTEATFPVTVGPVLTFGGGTGDAFVAKVNAAGTALEYCGYIGGSGFDWGFGIAVDGAGNAYVTGQTSSSEATFPVTVGPDLTWNGGNDAFVVKVNAAGTAFVYAGYIGGSSNDQGRGIAVDSAGNAYVTGDTSSTEATFPVTVGPGLTFNGGFSDAFVAKVNAAGTALVYAGYIGGSDSDNGTDIVVDGAGNAYVTGYTNSTEATFPVTVGPDLTYNGAADAFVAKVNAAGTALVYAGYIGGSGDDVGRGIAVDAAGNAYVTGSTSSTEATFPVTLGPDLTHNGGADAFVAKVNPAGTAFVYAGYIGGSGQDSGHGIAVDGSGNAYVTGSTTSTEATFPVTVGPDLTFNGGTLDVFVAKVSAKDVIDIQGRLAIGGAPVVGATMQLTNKTTGVKTTTTSNAIGAYQFDPVEPGKYKITTKRWVVVASTSTVSGNVTVKGAPLVGAKVKLGTLNTTTDAGGNFSFSGVAPGKYKVIVVTVPVP